MTYLHRLGHRKQRQFRGPRNIWGSLLQELQGQSFAAYQGQDHHCQKQLHLRIPQVPLRQHRQEHHLMGQHSLLQLLPDVLCEQRLFPLDDQHVHGVQDLNLHDHAGHRQQLLQRMLKLSMKY